MFLCRRNSLSGTGRTSPETVVITDRVRHSSMPSRCPIQKTAMTTDVGPYDVVVAGQVIQQGSSGKQ